MEVFKNHHPNGSIAPTSPHILLKLNESLTKEDGLRDGFYDFPKLLSDQVGHATMSDPAHEYPNELVKGGFTFRSPELGNSDLVALGCSQTYGIGICEENTWPALLAKNLGISYANIAVPGYSVARSVLSFFSYIETYGKPKAVAILLPDMYRVYLPVGSPHSMAQNVASDEKIKMVNSTISAYAGLDDPWEELSPLFSKKPHKIEDVLYPEISYSQGFTMLNVLLMFCKYSDIAVVVDTWDRELSHVLNALDYISDDVFANTYVDHPGSDCLQHEDFRHSLKHDEFYAATDRTLNPHKGEHKPHMGAHKHIHFSEQMAKKLRKQLKS